MFPARDTYFTSIPNPNQALLWASGSQLPDPMIDLRWPSAGLQTFIFPVDRAASRRTYDARNNTGDPAAVTAEIQIRPVTSLGALRPT